MATTTSHSAYGTALLSAATITNSLATGSSFTSAACNSAKALNGDLYVSIALQGSARSTGAKIDVYVIRSADAGSTYEDFISGSQQFVGAISFDAATTARTGCAPDIPLPPGFFKIVLVNNTGQALAAASNTCTLLPHNVESN